MRHRQAGKKFNRDTKGRKALLRGLVRNLVVYGHIVTTESKAKEVKRLADKLMNVALVGDLTARRKLHTFFGKRDVVNTLVDGFAPLFSDRKSGFTSLQVVGLRRGDNSKMVEVRFTQQPATVGTLTAPQEKSAVAAKKAPATDSAPKVAKKQDTKSSVPKAAKTSTKKIAEKPAVAAKKTAARKTTTKKAK